MYHHDSRPVAEAEAQTLEWFQNRHAAMIEEGRKASAGTLHYIEETGNMLADYVVPLNGPGRFAFDPEAGKVLMRHQNGQSLEFTLHPHAAQQAAARLGIPGAYLRELIDGKPWQKRLAAECLQQNAEHGPRDRVLVRSIAGQARGILSTNYKRLDSAKILAGFLKAAHDNGAVVYKAWHDDTRFQISAALPQVFQIQTVKNGVEFISVGLQYGTSDFGDGADDVRAWIERVWCTNKAVGMQQFKQVHLGKALPDNVELSRQTFAAETLTRALVVGDVVTQALNQTAIRSRFEAIMDASAVPLDLEQETTRLGRAGLQKGEIEAVEKILAQNDPAAIPGGPLTTWKLSQTISAVAQQAENPRRRMDLEELAGSLIFGKAKAGNN